MEVIILVVLSVLSDSTVMILEHLLRVHHGTALLRYRLSLLWRVFTEDRPVLELSIQLRLFCATVRILLVEAEW